MVLVGVLHAVANRGEGGINLSTPLRQGIELPFFGKLAVLGHVDGLIQHNDAQVMGEECIRIVFGMSVRSAADVTFAGVVVRRRVGEVCIEPDLYMVRGILGAVSRGEE